MGKYAYINSQGYILEVADTNNGLPIIQGIATNEEEIVPNSRLNEDDLTSLENIIKIMDIAKEIGTFETSILPYEDCCTIFVPKHPKTKPQLEAMRKAESVLDIDAMVEKAINDTELVVY